VGTRARAPYKSVLTHGFVVDGQGKAMHKSAGNVISPEELIKDYGAEIIRLWVAAEDYTDNIRLSKEILQRLTEAYRRIRNTCRFILGNLYDFDPTSHSVPQSSMEEIDKWILHKAHRLNQRLINAYRNYEFHIVYHGLHNFCVVDLSSLYLDILKDRLYTSHPESEKRRSSQTAMYHILNILLRLMAPILSFTAEEIWQYLPNKEKSPSVHMEEFWPIDDSFIDTALEAKWERLLKIREEVNRVLEMKRKSKEIGHSLDAIVTLGADEDTLQFLKGFGDLREIFIVSKVELLPLDQLSEEYNSQLNELRIKATLSPYSKCERCWVRDDTVTTKPFNQPICGRCLEVLEKLQVKPS
jgi:isoleucyl-tRNA synthetase